MITIRKWLPTCVVVSILVGTPASAQRSNVRVILDIETPEQCPCRLPIEGDFIELRYRFLTLVRAALELGDDAFVIDVDPIFRRTDNHLIFLQFEFSNRTFYGFPAGVGTGGIFNNYFYYAGGRLHYLGVFPDLNYDEQEDLYSGTVRVGIGEYYTSCYSFQASIGSPPALTQVIDAHLLAR